MMVLVVSGSLLRLLHFGLRVRSSVGFIIHASTPCRPCQLALKSRSPAGNHTCGASARTYHIDIRILSSMMSGIPLYWALEPESEILILMWSRGAL